MQSLLVELYSYCMCRGSVQWGGSRWWWGWNIWCIFTHYL